ncbi:MULTISPECIES: AAA family ATPase [Amycolatopsis]|nr:MULTISPECIES: AAA family ATPase [Amycolatopsis]
MYIRRVVLRGIKGFEDADFNFAPDVDRYPGWAAITGDNGSGKTSLLKAIAVALLGPDQVRSLLPDLRGWVQDGLERGTISVEVKPHHEYDKTRQGGNPVAGTFWAEVEIERQGPVYEITPADVFRHKKKGAINGPWQQSTQGWFTLGYGPFRRLYGSSPDAQRLMVIPGRVPRFATLFKEDATLAEGEEWIKQLQYKKLEEREHEPLVLEALLSLLSDEFLRNGITIHQVDSEGVWIKDSADRIMPLTDMSDGYRSAVAMLIDIFRHMVEVYGPRDLVIRDDSGKFVVDRPGVVMIDEVDAHLHPAWQREIGFWLKSHFPRIQFLITTHSPLVCQAADNGRIYHLPQPGEGAPFMIDEHQFNQIVAGRPNEILLTSAFGLDHTRSPRAVTARERRARLLAKQRQLPLSGMELEEMRQLDLFAEVEG